MKSSVEHHMIADVEVGSFLSSGVDSSYLVALARPDKTYTAGYNIKKYDETSYVKDLTNKLNINNKVVKIGKQIWLAENFRYLPSIEKGDKYENSWVFNNDVRPHFFILLG